MFDIYKAELNSTLKASAKLSGGSAGALSGLAVHTALIEAEGHVKLSE